MVPIMILHMSQLEEGEAYRLLIQLVIPRPIAWVLTDNGDGSHNLAPFSFFNAVCAEPPILAVGVGLKDDGTKKDTWRNIAERADFVVHLPPAKQAGQVVQTAATLPPGQSEITWAGLAVESVVGWPLPRLIGPPAAFWCQRERILEIGGGPSALILGIVQSAWVDDSARLASADGRLRFGAAALNPLVRLGGQDYTTLGPIRTVARPD